MKTEKLIIENQLAIMNALLHMTNTRGIALQLQKQREITKRAIESLTSQTNGNR